MRTLPAHVEDKAPASRETVRMSFVMQQVLGHIAAYQNFRGAVELDPAVAATWTEVTYYAAGGWLERLPGIPASAKGGVRGALQVRSGLRQAPSDAILFNSQALCKFELGMMRRVPSVIVTDVTPCQYDALGQFYPHAQPKMGALRRLKHEYMRRMYDAARLIVPWSHWVKDSLIHDYDVPAQKVVVVPPGVNVERWAPPPPQLRENVLRARGDIPGVLFVGGDFERKGGTQLLDWFLQRGQGRCELHIVTRTPPDLDGPVAGLHIHTGLEANDPQLMQLYLTSHIFVLPTLADCFGIASIEAMATGLPVITTNVGGVPDIVTPGHDGFLIAPHDDAALAQALEQLVTGSSLRAAMGRHARATAVARFDARKNAERVIDLMKQLVASEGNA